MVAIRQVWVGGVVVKVISLVIGAPGGSGVFVPALSIAWPAVRRSVVLSVIVVGVRWVTVVLSI
ncbi:hypothetical protein [Kribbella kalugense]|uniref:hypothetical protein n=1 Tax=Kribbella kalugense TaxID=2512221 RepID=UPI001EDD3EA2|nr:hypothetical protein [Kribbella kalugense]